MSTLLASLGRVDLAELSDRAALMTRVDRKYVLTADQLVGLIARLPHGTRALDIGGELSFEYTSTYLDTPTLGSFHAAAHKRRGRWKVRTRSYVDSGTHFLEVKARRGEATRKERIEWWGNPQLDERGRDFVAASLARAGVRQDTLQLRPTLVTRYRRTTLLLPGSGSRATIDTALEWSDASGAARLARPRLVIVETKTAGRPSEVDGLLWAAGRRPGSVSKDAGGLAPLRQDLPRNRWHRLLASPPFDSPRV